MKIWELALLLLSVTYLMVNTGYLILMVKTMSKYDGILTKSLKLMENFIDKASKEIEEDES